eukprot:11220600-Lingulodinium_polyedra.AAC.1
MFVCGSQCLRRSSLRVAAEATAGCHDLQQGQLAVAMLAPCVWMSVFPPALQVLVQSSRELAAR